jgi:hypothetical protein
LYHRPQPLAGQPFIHDGSIPFKVRVF